MKRTLTSILTLLMVLCLVPGMLIPALAEEAAVEDVLVAEETAEGAEGLPQEVEEITLIPEAAEREPEANAPVSNAAKSDFEIVDGVLVKYTGAGGDVVIPKGVNSIGNDAFYRCKTLTSVVIPEGVTEIGSAYGNIETGAFAYCTKLKKVTLPKGLKLIGGSAFYRCKKLRTIDIPSTVKTISTNAFQESGLKGVVIPDSVTEIKDAAFETCKSLKTLTLPKVNKYDSLCAFMGCTALESVTIPGGHEYIASSMFEGCASLKKVIIEEGVTSIFDAFYDCKALKIAIIPKSVTEISDQAFYGAEQLTIYGYAKSYAQKYAKAHKIAFVSLDKVTPKATSLKSVSGGKKQLTVKWKKVSGADGYKLQYALKKNFSDAKTVTVKGAKTISKTIKSLKAKKRYYVRVCAYKKANGETWRSAWSKAMNVKTK